MKLEHLQNMPNLAMLGLIIEGVHDLELLRSEVTSSNFATLFPNNAFCLHRLNVNDSLGNPISLEERLFPVVTDDKQLGQTTMDGKTLDIVGNEEIALVLSLLSIKVKPDVSLMAMERLATITRDPSQERRPADFKIRRRQIVAEAYQRYFNVTTEELNTWLRNHYSIIYS